MTTLATSPNRVALISGAARGQGREIARALAEEGADIAAFDICGPLSSTQYAPSTPEDLQETARIVEKAGTRCVTDTVDVRSYEQVKSFVDRTLAELGQIDIVCANAGIAHWKRLPDLTPSEWQEMLDTNATGAFNTIHPVVPHFMERLRGAVVLTSSVNGQEAAKGMAHYTASKHAVIGLMKNLALELGDYGVRVNAVLPSAIATHMGMNPENMRWIFGRDDATEEEYYIATRNWHAIRNRPALQPSAVAEVVSWLVSDRAKNITGMQVPVDAGHLILPGFNHDAVVE